MLPEERIKKIVIELIKGIDDEEKLKKNREILEIIFIYLILLYFHDAEKNKNLAFFFYFRALLYLHLNIEYLDLLWKNAKRTVNFFENKELSPVVIKLTYFLIFILKKNILIFNCSRDNILDVITKSLNDPQSSIKYFRFLFSVLNENTPLLEFLLFYAIYIMLHFPQNSVNNIFGIIFKIWKKIFDIIEIPFILFHIWSFDKCSNIRLSIDNIRSIKILFNTEGTGSLKDIDNTSLISSDLLLDILNIEPITATSVIPKKYVKLHTKVCKEIFLFYGRGAVFSFIH